MVWESANATGPNRMNVPWVTISLSPAALASSRNRATASRLRTGSGGSPYRSASSASTALTSASLRTSASRLYISSRNRSDST